MTKRVEGAQTMKSNKQTNHFEHTHKYNIHMQLISLIQSGPWTTVPSTNVSTPWVLLSSLASAMLSELHP